MNRTFMMVAVASLWAAAGCSTDPEMCIVDTRCVAACGDTPTSSGCDPCPEGTFDVMTCPSDGGPPDGGDAGDAGDSSVGPVTCGDGTCGAGEYCVVPCCGGALPICQPREEDGTCPAGTSEGGFCEKMTGTADCAPDPCTPPAPYCTPADTCTGDACPAGPTDCYDGVWDAASQTFSCLCA